MNFYSEKCVIHCSYIAHTPKFLKCCYNNAFIKVLRFQKKKKKESITTLANILSFQELILEMFHIYDEYSL